MKMDVVAGSQNDEFYTPAYAVRPILKYVPKGATVWCPFDSAQSHFVSLLMLHGCDVLWSHLDEGLDFFNYEPEDYDCIVSNPPYSKKAEVIRRCFLLGKPFALLVGVVGLFESADRFEPAPNGVE